MISFHILTESRGTKLEVGDILGKGLLEGLPIMTHPNRSGPFSKALNTAIIDLITLFRECLLNDRSKEMQIKHNVLTSLWEVVGSSSSLLTRSMYSRTGLKGPSYERIEQINKSWTVTQTKLAFKTIMFLVRIEKNSEEEALQLAENNQKKHKRKILRVCTWIRNDDET